MPTKPTSKGEVTLKDVWGGRSYIIDGTEYVSTTTPLGILAYPFLEIWRVRVGKTKAGLISKRAAKYGTKIHKYAADILEEKLKTDNDIPISEFFDVEELHPKYQAEIRAIQEWIEENVDEIIGIEKTVYSEDYRIAGAVDLICTLKGRKGVYWCDWKTGHIKDEAMLQLSSYCKLTVECGTAEFEGRALELLMCDPKDYHRLVLSVKKSDATGLGRVKEVEPLVIVDGEDINLEANWETYLKMLGVWQWYRMNRVIRAKNKEFKKKAKEEADKAKAARKLEREKKKLKKEKEAKKKKKVKKGRIE